MAGGAAAAFAFCERVLLAGGPLIMSVCNLDLAAHLLLVRSAFLCILSLSLTLGADWLLSYCIALSSFLCVSMCCDLVSYLWLFATLGGGIGLIMLALSLGLSLMLVHFSSSVVATPSANA